MIKIWTYDRDGAKSFEFESDCESLDELINSKYFRLLRRQVSSGYVDSGWIVYLSVNGVEFTSRDFEFFFPGGRSKLFSPKKYTYCDYLQDKRIIKR